MVFFHADDFGISVKESKRILECNNNGVLNSVSVMPNGLELAECMSLLDASIYKSIHINLAEGHCCAEKSQVSLLVDDQGCFCNGFIKLLLLSFLKPRKVRQQVEIECKAQIKTILPYLGEGYRLRVDSHVHYHMIPMVFRGLLRALADTGREVEYIRWPLESITPYIRNFAMLRKISFINMIKIMVLKVCGLFNRPALKKYGLQNKISAFWGVGFTGCMSKKVISELLKDYIQQAQKKDLNLEVLFHPGAVLGEEIKGADIRFSDFYTSQNRFIEADALKALQNGLHLSKIRANIKKLNRKRA